MKCSYPQYSQSPPVYTLYTEAELHMFMEEEKAVTFSLMLLCNSQHEVHNITVTTSNPSVCVIKGSEYAVISCENKGDGITVTPQQLNETITSLSNESNDIHTLIAELQKRPAPSVDTFPR